MEGKAQNPARDMEQLTDDLQSLVVSHGKQQAIASTPSEGASQRTGFFDLPLELRTMIYESALSRPETITTYVEMFGPKLDLPDMLLLSKQVFREAQPIFYRQNDFLIQFRLWHVTPSIFPWLQRRIADAGNMQVFRRLNFRIYSESDWHYLPYLAPILDMLRRGELRCGEDVKFKWENDEEHMREVFSRAKHHAMSAKSTADLLDIYERYCVQFAQATRSSYSWQRRMDIRRIGIKEEMDNIRLSLGVSVDFSEQVPSLRLSRSIGAKFNGIRSLELHQTLRKHRALISDIKKRGCVAQSEAE